MLDLIVSRELTPDTCIIPSDLLILNGFLAKLYVSVQIAVDLLAWRLQSFVMQGILLRKDSLQVTNYAF